MANHNWLAHGGEAYADRKARDQLSPRKSVPILPVGVLEPEAVLPEQLSQPSWQHKSGELRLYWEILVQGIETVMGRVGCTAAEYWQDHTWLSSDSETSPLDFQSLCSLFDINPDYIRPKVLEEGKKAQRRIRDGYLLPDLDGPRLKLVIGGSSSSYAYTVERHERRAETLRKNPRPTRTIACEVCGSEIHQVNGFGWRRKYCRDCRQLKKNEVRRAWYKARRGLSVVGSNGSTESMNAPTVGSDAGATPLLTAEGASGGSTVSS
jgi:hypothetical protein